MPLTYSEISKLSYPNTLESSKIRRKLGYHCGVLGVNVPHDYDRISPSSGLGDTPLREADRLKKRKPKPEAIEMAEIHLLHLGIILTVRKHYRNLVVPGSLARIRKNL